MKPIENPAVARAFAAYPPRMRRKLMALRGLIFRTAASTDGVGPIEEALKWGDPAYVTSQSRSGSTIRLAIVFSENGPLPVEPLSSCVAAALTYHRAKSPPRAK